MILRRTALSLCVALWASASMAASAISARNFPGCNVGVASTVCLTANTAQNFVQMQNVSASGGATITCAWGATPVLNTLPGFTLTPGQPASWGPQTSGIPSGALNCIASGANTQMFLEWN